MTRLRPALESDEKGWSDFVARSCNGTVFHLPDFFRYHPAGRFDNHHLLFESDDGIEALIPGALSLRDGSTWFRSYPGASWGGPVIQDSTGLADIEGYTDMLLEYCRGKGWGGIEITLPPQAYFRRPHNYIDFALLQRGFAYRKRELTAVIDLSRMGEEIDLAFRDSARRGVTKARREGVAVVEDPDFSKFYPVLETNLQDRHGVRPTHTLEELERVRSLLGPDRIRQFVAVRDGAVLAGMVMFNCNPRVTLAFYISHDARHQQSRPVNLVYREVIRWARENGFRYLDLGTFTLNMEVNYGLCRFKESFSARGQFRDTFTLELQG
jgi:hypothetical protein